jgi:hypothetical protein
MSFKNLNIIQKREVITALIIDGLTYAEIEKQFNVCPEEIAELIDETAVQPYNILYPKNDPNHEAEHKKTIFGWLKGALFISVSSFLVIAFVQILLGGFDSENVTRTLAYITSPLSKVLNASLGVSVVVVLLYLFFPILTTFINDKVNTVYLKDEFMKAKPESKLNFLAIIVMALCLFVGLVFSAKAQSPRECIIKTAAAEIGVLETGHNRGQRIDFYRSVSLGHGVKNYSDPWCGYFADYVYKSCNIKTVKYAPRAANWFTDSKKMVYRANFKGSILQKQPQAGDVIGYKFRAGNIGHIEILKEWNFDEDYFISIGGNTSNKLSVYRDANTNDGVREKRRDISAAFTIHNLID